MEPGDAPPRAAASLSRRAAARAPSGESPRRCKPRLPVQIVTAALGAMMLAIIWSLRRCGLPGWHWFYANGRRAGAGAVRAARAAARRAGDRPRQSPAGLGDGADVRRRAALLRPRATLARAGRGRAGAGCRGGAVALPLRRFQRAGGDRLGLPRRPVRRLRMDPAARACRGRPAATMSPPPSSPCSSPRRMRCAARCRCRRPCRSPPAPARRACTSCSCCLARWRCRR